MIVNYPSSIINKLKALLTDDARVIIYDRHVFIVQATGLFPFVTPIDFAIFSSCAGSSGRTQTLNIGMMRQVFYHCAATSDHLFC
jgi:hypothetical protein